MRVHALCGMPDRHLQNALAAFEARFTYPLSPTTRFRISHGEDYGRFFRSMGASRVFVAERDGEVLGTIGAAVRTLHLPAGRSCATAYIGDLKVAAGVTAGRTLIGLAEDLRSWVVPQVATAFSVVMNGTNRTPDRYTGRSGLPQFEAVGQIAVLRIASRDLGLSSCKEISEEAGLRIFHALTRAGVAAFGGDANDRSSQVPRWLRTDDENACGRLEDTQRAKRIFEVSGKELCSTHLSYFAYKEPRAGAVLVRAALTHAARLGVPALFVALPYAAATTFFEVLEMNDVLLTSATVYATGLPSDMDWFFNTAEI